MEGWRDGCRDLEDLLGGIEDQGWCMACGVYGHTVAICPFQGEEEEEPAQERKVGRRTPTAPGTSSDSYPNDAPSVEVSTSWPTALSIRRGRSRGRLSLHHQQGEVDCCSRRPNKQLQQRPEEPENLFPWCTWCGKVDHHWRDCSEVPLSWCGRCEEGGHDWSGCPYASSPVPKREEPECPQPKREEPEHPQSKREEPECPQPKREEPERPQPKREEPERPQPKREEPERPQPKREEPERPQPKREELYLHYREYGGRSPKKGSCRPRRKGRRSGDHQPQQQFAAGAHGGGQETCSHRSTFAVGSTVAAAPPWGAAGYEEGGGRGTTCPRSFFAAGLDQHAVSRATTGRGADSIASIGPTEASLPSPRLCAGLLGF
ncbi:UNVERIFIED_CONTAM: hypothetical protein FKN15_067978 [Acipenser sinensis]